MRIFVNNTEHSIEERTSVSALLAFLSQQYPQLIHARGVALAVNEQVILRQEWAGHLLRDGDKVEFFTASQGG